MESAESEHSAPQSDQEQSTEPKTLAEVLSDGDVKDSLKILEANRNLNTTQGDIRDEGGIISVSLHGAMVHGDAGMALRTLLLSLLECRRSIAIDLEDIGIVSSGGIDAFILFDNQMKRTDGTYALHSLPSHITEVMSITRLDRKLAIKDDADAAREFLLNRSSTEQ